MTNRFRPVNQLLGSQPRIGPFPADQLVPWFLICAVAYFFGHQLCNLDWMVTALLMGWGCSTWWILTGSHAWRYLSKFQRTPNWTRGRMRYRSVLAFMSEQKAAAAAPRTRIRKRNPS